MKLSDLKFGMKLTFLFGTIMFLFMTSTLLSLAKLSDLTTQAENNDAGHEIREVLKQAYIDHLIWHKNLSKVFTQNKISHINIETNEHHCNFGEWYYSEKRKETEAIMPELKNLLNDIEKPHQSLHLSVIKMNDVVQKQDSNCIDVLKEIYQSETEKKLNEVTIILEKIISKSYEIVVSDDEIRRLENTIKIQLIISTAIAIVLSILFAALLSRSVLNTINKGVKHIELVSQGDLTVKSDIRTKDEIGMMLNNFVVMVEKIKNIIRNVASGANNISQATQDMTNNSQQLSQGANEQAASLEEISSSTEQLSSNIQQNTNNAQQTEKIAQKASNEILNGSKAVNETAQAMKTISEKNNIISEIAFQTNILALNAAVEAARAGVHGKGFAVVATEVRRLAERSQLAAKEINEITDESVVIAEKTSSLFTEIVPLIQKTSDLVQEIYSASVEQNAGIDQISKALQTLNQITQQNAASSEELATSSEEIESQSKALVDAFSFFKIDE